MTAATATVGRDLGRMLEALSAIVLASTLVAVVWGEFFAVPAFLAAGAVAFAVGRLLVTRFADAPEPGKLHGMMIAASGWFAVALFGSLPFLFVAVTMQQGWFGAPAPDPQGMVAFRNPLNSFFESMSGFTGTGLTMTVDETAIPHVVQWWRTTTEWVGGVGVIVLTTAILARPGSGSLTLYESEARSKKIHPSIVSTVRTIWWIFLLFTFLAITLLWLAGMPLWEAINHAMTGLATGGFSVTDNSLADYSALVQYAMWPVMVLGSIAFPIHYVILRGDYGRIYRDLQTRWVFGFFAVGATAVVAFALHFGTYDSLATAIQYGGFQFISAASCTGFGTANVATWSAPSQLVLSLGMFVGAAAGSTVGGIKLVRAATLAKGTLYRIRNVFYPSSAVRHFELDGRTLSSTEASQEFEEAAIIAFLWTVFLVAGVFVLLFVVPDSYTLENVVFEVASAQGNVGLSTGITGPDMSVVAKVAFLFNMWIGRLEIIPVLVLLRSVLARGDRR